MAQNEQLTDWRADKGVVRTNAAYTAAEAAVMALENDLRVTSAELRAAEAACAEAEYLITQGKGEARQLIDSRSHAMKLRARLNELQAAGPDLYSALEEARQAKAKAETAAQAVVWQALLAEYIREADAFEKTLEAAVDQQERLQAVYDRLRLQFDTSDAWIRGPGLTVGSALFGVRRLSRASLADWKAHRQQANIVDNQTRAHLLAEAMAAQVRRLASAATRQQESKEREAEEARRQGWVWTRDLSPSKLVSVRMQGPPTVPPAA